MESPADPADGKRTVSANRGVDRIGGWVGSETGPDVQRKQLMFRLKKKGL